ncbi:hypothetical protein BH09BAC3_BH09BAC3_16660 [soil metagenome]
MKKIFLLIGLLSMVKLSLAQEATDIFLFDLSVKKDKVVASKPINITKHKGYDNQPSFHPALPMIYYSSFDEAGRADIISYNYKTGKAAAITQTPEKEYSPTVTLDQQSLSCIIQRDDGKQDLGKYPIDGGQPFVIIDNMKVGYHVWADNSHLGLFILGTPNTLHYLLLPIKKDTIIAENIGRSLHRIPGQAAISFVHKVSDSEWVIKRLDNKTLEVTTLINTLPGREDLAWTPDGKIIMSDGTKLFFAQPGKGKAWTALDISSGFEVLKNVTRVAVSADGKKLAVVVVE